jgi:uncharacterized lipoprotein YddW (UPF0748 family)
MKLGHVGLVRLYLGLLAAALLVIGEPGYSSSNDSPPKVMRAIWVQPDAASTPEKADRMIKKIKRGGFNTILYGVLPSDVYYRSALLPQSRYVTPEYDPLAYVVKQGHASGLKVQAWWSCGIAPRFASFRDRYPTWDMDRLSEAMERTHWLNFSLPEVRQFVGDVVLEIAQNYPVDGVHLDYIRYPDNASDWGGIGDADVPSTVQSAYQRLKAIRPEVQLTAAVAGSQARSRSTRQHWADWLRGEYIDRVFPMAYLDPDQTYARLSGSWTLELAAEEWQALPHREHIAPGLKVVFEDGGTLVAKAPEQFIAQVEVCRRDGFSDMAVFDEKTITAEILDALAARPEQHSPQ